MKKKKDLLSHKQFAINCRANAHTQRTNRWLARQGLGSSMFETTAVQLLQALQQANLLLEHHSQLLTEQQHLVLHHFKRQMSSTPLRDRLKESAAFPIFTINKKINRQLFKQHRQLTKI